MQLHMAKQNTLKAVRLSKRGPSLPHKTIGDLRLRLRFNYFTGEVCITNVGQVALSYVA